MNAAYATFVACSAALGGFLFGFDSAVVNGAVPGIQATFHSSSAGTGFAVASILLGCAVGALFAGRLADRIGLRATLALTGLCFALTAIWTGWVGSEPAFNLARLLSGVAVSAASAVGFAAGDSLAVNLVSGGIYIAATVLAIALIDRIGRRPLLPWGAVGMVLTLTVLAAALSTAQADAAGQLRLAPPYGLVALIAANAYVFAFGVSWDRRCGRCSTRCSPTACAARPWRRR